MLVANQLRMCFESEHIVNPSTHPTKFGYSLTFETVSRVVIRVKILSVRPIVAFSAGTKLATKIRWSYSNI